MPKRFPPCDSCGSEDVARIIWGLPVPPKPGSQMERDVNEGRIVYGGCAISGNDPDFRCKACGHEWRQSPNVDR
ncbi:MAG: hypothetical protein EA377_07075 [Phycisphaerales bacterium]|nr:MAG: hypothetical protein EA377_07075 [Phycisphaerales bacterium]